MSALGLEFLRFLDGQEKERQEVRHQEILDRITRAAVVASGSYDEKKVFKEYFPVDTASQDLDYAEVEWGQDLAYQAPDESELEILQRMLEDNTVQITGTQLTDGPQPGIPTALPDDTPVIEQIETDREWV